MTALRRATALAHILARCVGTPPPRVVTQLPRDVERGSYAAQTRTLIISLPEDVDDETLCDVVTHEFQHYVDDLHGRADPGGWPRGTHAPQFYVRLDGLRARARAAGVDV